MSEVVSQGETEGSEGRKEEGRVGGTVSLRAAASGEHKVQRTPEKKNRV